MQRVSPVSAEWSMHVEACRVLETINLRVLTKHADVENRMYTTRQSA